MTITITHTMALIGLGLIVSLLCLILYYVSQIYSAVRWTETLQYQCQAQLIEMAARVEATHRIVRTIAGLKNVPAAEPANTDTGE